MRSIAFAAVAAVLLAGCGEVHPGSDAAQVQRGMQAIDGIPQDGFTLGRPQARWTLTVISSATSFELDQMITMLPGLVKTFVRPGRVNIQLRTPSTGRYGGNGDERTAAGALLAAGLQGRYWDAVVRLAPTYPGRLRDTDVATLLRRSGVADVRRAMTERAGPRVRAALARADAVAATATATFPAAAARRRVMYLLTRRGEGPRDVTTDGELGRLVEVLGSVVR
jgi:hypothetical protein